ncbi:MAG: heparinase II/III family protein [Anaerolineae bacterium]|nr:heparinase II/III family protein [Anaerolineae bacterium]
MHLAHIDMAQPMNLQRLIGPTSSPDPLLNQIRKSPSAQVILNYLRTAVPNLPGPAADIPQTTYTLYRQFAHTGERAGYEKSYFAKRSMLTRAVVEMLLGNKDMGRIIHDLLWSICEETSWVLPAHENLGPGFKTLDSTTSWPGGSITSLTCEPDYIDLFAAETGAGLAEAIHLLGDHLAPEVVQRARQEVERRIMRPYLAHGRDYWWHRGDSNWNAVCNGAVGLAFARMEREPRRLAEGLVMVLEGFEAYLATGFEADGGSLEGVGYWNYGLLYYVAVAELLYERTGGRLDLMANPRLFDIARFPLAMSLAPGRYLNFGDADERIALQPGIVQRLAERTGLADLQGLIALPDTQEKQDNKTARLAIILRDIAWWDGQPQPFPTAAKEDVYLPACAAVKFNAQTAQGQPVVLAAKAGRNDGHHYHADIGHFIVAVDGESLLCDPGRGLYTREYFNQRRFENIFCNSFGHSVPCIGGQLQTPGPKFGSGRLAEGKIIDYGEENGEKIVVIDFTSLYDVPGLALARRELRLAVDTGEIRLEDTFEFSDEHTEIEEAFVTWYAASVNESTARIAGQQSALTLVIKEPIGIAFSAASLEVECQANRSEGILNRLTVNLPVGTRHFVLQMIPQST